MIPPATLHDPVNLIARLPTLMKKYDEIIKITDSQNPEFDFVWSIEEWMRRQIYIITAEEYGLQRYERLLSITPLPHENYKARRNHVLVRWNQQTPYTFRFLIGLLEILTEGNFEIIPNFHEYEMEIRVFTLDSGILQDLAFIKRHIIPANLALNSCNEIRFTFKAHIKLTTTINQIKHYKISQNSTIKITPTANLSLTTSVIQITHYQIKNGA